jgi:hypothetical protein
VSRKFAITVEVEMSSTDTKWDAELWLTSVLQKALKHPDSAHPAKLYLHPYNPVIVSTVEVDKP